MADTPKIRFKDFTEDWEQKKLGNVVNVYSGKDYKHLEDGDIPVYGTGGYMLSVSEALSESENAIGIGRKGTIDNPYILKAPFRTIDTLFYCIPNNGYDLDFTFGVFQNINWKSMDESTGVPSLSKTAINNVNILLPAQNEQDKIGTYFSTLDYLITLHQRKCNDIKELKKCMLQKMFPKKDKKIPEIRFAGFTDDWEERKLGELIKKYEDPVETPHDGYERLGIRSHAKGTFHSYVESGKELGTAKMHRVAADKFIVNITFAWEHAVAITDENDEGKLVSHRFPQFSFNAELKSLFFKYVMFDKKFREYLELSSPGGAGRNRVLKINDMLKYDVKLPNIKEQKKIGEYFRNLDHLISLHQHKCDELKEVKKFMLQNMFP